MKTNVAAVNKNRTHEGGMAAPKTSALAELKRTVNNCLLFETTFYEKGNEIADRIFALVGKVKPEEAATLADYARNTLGLRHVSLWVARAMASHFKGNLVSETIAKVIQRADEPAEFLSLYWKDGRKPLSAQVKKGLAKSFTKFNAYNLAKYNKDGTVKLRDVLFLTHAKPKDDEQAGVWKKLVDGTLKTPDTWEVALSSGADKKATWERLLVEGKLGALALLRNLRNMEQAGVDRGAVIKALKETKAKGVLPFQFVSAARFGPAFTQGIDVAMQNALGTLEGLEGSTALVVDVSGSMDYKLSEKSQMLRLDAAGALAVLLAGTGDVRVFTFSNNLVEVPAYKGLALVDAIRNSQGHSGTYLARTMQALNPKLKGFTRTIVITDEQSHDAIVAPSTPTGYIINVAPYKPALDTSGGWVRIDGFSERVVDWIKTYEAGMLVGQES